MMGVCEGKMWGGGYGWAGSEEEMEMDDRVVGCG